MNASIVDLWKDYSHIQDNDLTRSDASLTSYSREGFQETGHGDSTVGKTVETRRWKWKERRKKRKVILARVPALTWLTSDMQIMGRTRWNVVISTKWRETSKKRPIFPFQEWRSDKRPRQRNFWPNKSKGKWVDTSTRRLNLNPTISFHMIWPFLSFFSFGPSFLFWK